MSLLRFGLTLEIVGGIIGLLALVIAFIIVVVTYRGAKYPKAKPGYDSHVTMAYQAAQDTPPQYGLMDRMGHAQWDFTTSWASILTVVGALLGTVLSGQQGATAQYGYLNLFFLLLVALAPLVYNFIGSLEEADPTLTAQNQSNTSALVQGLTQSNPNVDKNTEDPMTYQYQGYVWGFLTASTFTLWAVIGELFTLIVLLGDIARPSSVNAYVLVIQLFLVVVVLCVGYYGWKTVPWTLQAQVSHKIARKKVQRNYLEIVRKMSPEEAAAAQGKRPEPALPSWSLL